MCVWHSKTGAVRNEGSNGNEENINEELPTHPQSLSDSPTTYNKMRVLGTVNGSDADSSDHLSAAHSTSCVLGDRVRALHDFIPFKVTYEKLLYIALIAICFAACTQVLSFFHTRAQTTIHSAKGYEKPFGEVEV